MKCNVDGAFYADQRHGATGAVTRDDADNFVEARAKWYEHGLDALTMEALACRDGLLMAQQAGVQRIWLETDCQDLVRLWNEGINQRPGVLMILWDVWEMSLNFQDFKFSFISRNCNRVAHSLAKQVIGSVRSGWWHVSPTCIESLLIADCNPGTV